MSRESGSVKWFSNEKGYGFIERSSGEDVFVHHSDILGEGFKTLRQGESVEFEVIEADKGPKAQQVQRSAGNGENSGASPRMGEGAGEDGPRLEAEEGGAAGDADRSLAAQLKERLGRRFFGD